jgi:hypothetical protein
MTVTAAEIAALVAADRDRATDAAVDGINAIEALQATAVWERLPLAARRQLCASHALLMQVASELA